MKKAFLLLMFIGALSASAAENLTFAEKNSVQNILQDAGYSGYIVTSGTKERADGGGWDVFARCSHIGTDYDAHLWASENWKKGKVISMKKRG